MKIRKKKGKKWGKKGMSATMYLFLTLYTEPKSNTKQFTFRASISHP